MKGNGEEVFEMGKEHKFGLMGLGMRENGKKESYLEKAHLTSHLEKATKEPGLTAEQMVWECTEIHKDLFIQV